MTQKKVSEGGVGRQKCQQMLFICLFIFFPFLQPDICSGSSEWEGVCVYHLITVKRWPSHTHTLLLQSVCTSSGVSRWCWLSGPVSRLPYRRHPAGRAKADRLAVSRYSPARRPGQQLRPAESGNGAADHMAWLSGQRRWGDLGLRGSAADSRAFAFLPGGFLNLIIMFIRMGSMIRWENL